MRRILPNSSIVHQDDFYRADKDIPVNEKGIADWDCPEAFDLDYMKKVLHHLKETGQFPEEFKSLEDTSSNGPVQVSEEELESAIAKLNQVELPNRTVIVEGIMLYHQGSSVVDELDQRLFLRAPYEDLKQRREGRAGYVTIEGFWQDPPGYFDDIVWPGYVKSHRYLFEHEDVENKLNDTALEKLKLQSPSNSQAPMNTVLDWTVDQIKYFLSHDS